jgi:hypothetical protein
VSDVLERDQSPQKACIYTIVRLQEDISQVRHKYSINIPGMAISTPSQSTIVDNPQKHH